ncbi:hypothetical protein niasHT_038718 [Heterodera trifolii]|uniref:Uncharacterized protein n=1 Tax=Heterodera trifolii TaxID=157864 RepID=A0ABD2ICB5_9BILA
MTIPFAGNNGVVSGKGEAHRNAKAYSNFPINHPTKLRNKFFSPTLCSAMMGEGEGMAQKDRHIQISPSIIHILCAVRGGLRLEPIAAELREEPNAMARQREEQT